MAFAVYDSADRSLVVGNAGFTRPVLVRDGKAEEIQVGGVPLGLLPDVEYDDEKLQLRSGDLIVFTSDGITESTDRRCEEFGAKRLQSALAGLNDLGAQAVADELVRSSDRHAVGNCNESDDRTVVVLKVL